MQFRSACARRRTFFALFLVLYLWVGIACVIAGGIQVALGADPHDYQWTLWLFGIALACALYGTWVLHATREFPLSSERACKKARVRESSPRSSGKTRGLFGRWWRRKARPTRVYVHPLEVGRPPLALPARWR